MDSFDFLILEFFGKQLDYIELNERSATIELYSGGLDLYEEGMSAYYNRIYRMANAGLLIEKNNDGSGRYKITQKGTEILANHNLKKDIEAKKHTNISIQGNNNIVAGANNYLGGDGNEGINVAKKSYNAQIIIGLITIGLAILFGYLSLKG